MKGNGSHENPNGEAGLVHTRAAGGQNRPAATKSRFRAGGGEGAGGKPAWAKALAGGMAWRAMDNIQCMLDSEYQAAMGALLVWSHVLFEIEKEEVNMQLDCGRETLAKEKSGSTEVKAADKPRTGNRAPQHIQDRRRE